MGAAATMGFLMVGIIDYLASQEFLQPRAMTDSQFLTLTDFFDLLEEFSLL